MFIYLMITKTGQMMEVQSKIFLVSLIHRISILKAKVHLTVKDTGGGWENTLLLTSLADLKFFQWIES